MRAFFRTLVAGSAVWGIAATAGDPPFIVPRLSPPVWIISPESNDRNGLAWEEGSSGEAVIDMSNNNLAIALHSGRLYFAFRSATHHHPKPPVWSPQYFRARQAKTRMYVVSASVPKDLWGKFDTDFSKLKWRLELEVNDWLRRETLHPHTESLLMGTDERALAARRWFEDTFGVAEVSPMLTFADSQRRSGTAIGTNGILKHFLEHFQSKLVEFDLREPLFVVMNGKLHFYFQMVEGKSMTFNSMRTWRMSLESTRALAHAHGQWSPPVPLLAPKEHFWEIQVRREKGADAAYLSSYSGGHYLVDEEDKPNLVHFKRSTDGLTFTPVDGAPHVYSGGASEAAFTLLPGKKGLWAVLRLDDGDDRGWGSLMGRADGSTLGAWNISPRADPRRFDSPRLFQHAGEIYLLARQNLCQGPDGKFDESKNCAYDREFVGQDEKTASLKRESIFEKIKSKVLSRKSTGKNGGKLGVSLQYEYTYYFQLPKRTALYHLDQKTGKLHEIAVLPSAGDTAFPSLVSLGNGEYLVANYSSTLEKPDWPWRDGQQNRTGIYFIKMSFSRDPPKVLPRATGPVRRAANALEH